jgi:hypothetical protein
MKKTTCANDITKKLDKTSEHIVRSSAKSSAKMLNNWTRFDREAKVITVNGKEAILL